MKLLIFFLLNFAALAVGSFLMGGEVTGAWYSSLNKAPWTPPGWVFGAAWTLIMICFSFFLFKLEKVEVKTNFFWGIYLVQWLLNVSWNPVFFKFHQVFLGLLLISALTLLIGWYLFNYRSRLGAWSLLVLPYFAWLCIATSLNAYVLFYN
jgi:tryptophan-rich sensory protein